MPGFLGTAASFRVDLNLTLQILMGISLLTGAVLARAKHFRAHGACMTSVLLLNLVMVLGVMWPSFEELVLPGIVRHFGKTHVMIAATHGLLGILAEAFGLYMVVMAGTNKIPEKWRLRRWKVWMRIEFAAWWVVLLTGIATYIAWYGPPRLR
jgi:uncharacterized membrane protein YozB (DUF420 family)